MLVKLIEELKQYVPVLVLYLAIHDKYGHVFVIASDIILVLVTVARIYAIVDQWVGRRFASDGQGLSFRSGFFFRKTTHVRWLEVTSLEVTQSAVERSLGCWKVVVTVGAGTKRSIAIDGVSQEVIQSFRELYDAARTDTSSLALPDDCHDVVYAMGTRDYFVVALTRGYPLLFLPVVFSIGSEILSAKGFRELAPHLSLVESVPLWLRVSGLILLFTVAAITSGAFVTWWRYGGFTVRERDGVLTASGGAVSRQTRSFPITDIQGVRIRRNPITHIFGRRSLGVMLRDGGGSSRTLDLLPVARASDIEAFIADRASLSFARSDDQAVAARSTPFAVMVILFAIACDVVILIVVKHPLGWVGALVVTLINFWLIDRYWTAIAVQPTGGMLLFRRGVAWFNEYRLTADAVHVMHFMSPRGGGFRLFSFVRLDVFASRSMRLSSAFVNASVASALHELISRRPLGVDPSFGRERDAVRSSG